MPVKAFFIDTQCAIHCSDGRRVCGLLVCLARQTGLSHCATPLPPSSIAAAICSTSAQITSHVPAIRSHEAPFNRRDALDLVRPSCGWNYQSLQTVVLRDRQVAIRLGKSLQRARLKRRQPFVHADWRPTVRTHAWAVRDAKMDSVERCSAEIKNLHSKSPVALQARQPQMLLVAVPRCHSRAKFELRHCIALVSALTTGTYEGYGTVYTLSTPSSGNCNFMSWPSDATTKYAALNAEQWEETMNCGRCAEVWCTDSSCASQSSEIVYIMDQCPGCEYGDLDLSPDVFEGITGQSYTKLGIEWKFVDCPISKNVEYCLKTGSSEFWVAIQPANFVSGVQSLKINGQETTVIDSAYYFLIDGSGESVADLNAVSISLTGVNGEVLEETVSLTADNCTEGNSQFSTSDATQSEIMAGSKSSTATTTSAPATATTPSPTPTPVHTPTQTPTAAPGPETNQMASSSGSSSTLRSNSDKAASSVDQDVAASVDEDIYQVSGSTDSQAPVTIAATDTGSVEQSSNATPTPTYQANVKSSGESSSTPLMVGMIILVCAAVLVAVGLALYVRRRKKQIDSYKRREEQGTAMSDDDTSPRASDASAYDIVHSPTVHFHP